MREIAYAKINLALHVRERRVDGYHRIETVFAFADDGDELSISAGEGLSLESTGPFAGELPAGADNLVLAAARALAEQCGVTHGAALRLDKRLPVAAGIGGGSADAAAALRLLNRWWRLDLPEAGLLKVAAPLGADVPACVLSRPIRGEGRGDQLSPLAEDLAGIPLLLVNPRARLPTGAVFRAWGGVDDGPLHSWRDGRNDLEAAAAGLVPEIGEVLRSLAEAPFARMSGSGATCFGLFENEASRDRAKAAITASHPHWWMLATRLR